jgi:hypothetical protein
LRDGAVLALLVLVLTQDPNPDISSSSRAALPIVKRMAERRIATETQALEPEFA